MRAKGLQASSAGWTQPTFLRSRAFSLLLEEPSGTLMRILVTGGAGFVGSHLCRALIDRGDRVVCVDNLSTGQQKNVDDLLRHKHFEFVHSDVSRRLDIKGPLDAVAHLASPASPPDYHRMPLETLAVGSRGTENALLLAERTGARFVLASTSEVYGDPAVHPQREDYWGNVNPVGPRSVYDEAKRFAEALTMAYGRSRNVNVGILRIFNTYGPNMRPRDGRVVSSFISQALNGDPLTIYGDGQQTRSFCYVADLVRGIVAMLDSTETGPINMGNPTERTMLELAHMVLTITGSASKIEHFPLPTDDPTRRRPDIAQAVTKLGWTPQVAIEIGLRHTVDFFVARMPDVASAAYALAGAQHEGDSRLGLENPA